MKIRRQQIVDSLYDSKIYSGGYLLDCGCGSKPYTEIFSDTVEKYIGIDLPASISGNKQTKKIDVYGDILNLPFKSGSFDTVLSTEVLEHVPEPSAALLEINRVLKKEGYLILITPMTWGLHEVPHDYYRYTRFGLKYLVEKSGFIVECINPQGGFFSMIGQQLSNFIFYWLGVDKKGIEYPLVFRAPVHIVCMLIQMLFVCIDKIYTIQSDILGNVIVAKKR